MINVNKNVLAIVVVGVLSWFPYSCTEDAPLPDNLVQFESESLGIGEDETEITINVVFSRAISAEASLTIQLAPEGVTYGTEFTTTPEAEGNTLALTVPANATGAQFTLSKIPGVLFDGDERIVFTIADAGQLVIGPRAVTTVTFAEIISEGASVEINGGGPTYPNRVFIDLSGNRQTAVLRTNWDLAFYTGSDFKVLLNSSNGMMARALDKTNMNAVTAADTAGWGQQLSLAALPTILLTNPTPSWVADAITWIDSPTDPLGDPAIDPIAATDSENKVYIVNRGTGPGSPAPALGWKKIRILRNGNGYTLQYADIGATTFSQVQINKDTRYNFVYVSLQNGAQVNVEPLAQRWDIAWNGFTSSTPYNSSNLGMITVPYYFPDIILQNLSGVETAMVLTSTITYEDFAESNLAAVDFSGQNQLKIGSSWRILGPSSPPALRTDRFYVIKDAAGNYYKLRFTALTTDGQRGRPRFEYALVKRGS
jgi:hypothetical protein